MSLQIIIMRHVITNLNFPERILLGLYTLFSFWLVVSLIGFFNVWTVASGLLVVLGVLVIPLFSGFRFTGIGSHSHWYRWLWLVVPVMLIGWMLLRGFYTGDAYAYWLPWGRDLALSGTMPAWIESIHMSYASAGPIWPLSVGAMFTILPIHEFSVTVLPLLFFTLGVLVMVAWMREKELSKGYQLIGVLLILFSSQTAFWSWNILTEAVLFLGFVLFFYFFEKAWSVNSDQPASTELQRGGGTGISNKEWVFLGMSFVFVVLVKFSSFLLVVPLIFLVINQRRSISLRRLLYWLLVSIPVLVWFGRNYMIYGNPIFPILNDFFGGPFAHIYSLSDPFEYWLERFPTTSSRAQFILKDLFITFPMVVLGLAGMARSKLKLPHIALLVVAVCAGIFFVFSASSGMRYLWPYMGLVAVYATIALRDMKSVWLRALSWLIALWSVLSIEPINSTSAFISSIESALSVIGVLAHYAYSYQIVILVIAIPVAYLLSRRVFVWRYSTILLLATGILHTRWIMNKSFLNTWTFILLLLALIVVMVLFKRFAERRTLLFWIGGIYLFSIFFVNSYAQAALFYAKNGFSFPVTHVFEQSSVLNPLLDQYHHPEDGGLLTLGGSDYYVWYYEIPAYTLNSFELTKRTGRVFNRDMGATDASMLLHDAGISTVANNAENYNDPISGDFAHVLDSDPSLFEKICNQGSETECIWKVK